MTILENVRSLYGQIMKLISGNNGLQNVNLLLYGKKLPFFGNVVKVFMLKILLAIKVRVAFLSSNQTAAANMPRG
jgi:hypothetical protein